MNMPKSPPELVERFHQIVPDDPDIERRKMFGYPACFINGNMFTGLHGQSMIVRLGPADRERLLREPGTHLFEPMPGRPMKEYVVVSDAILADDWRIAPWVAAATDFVRTLPPKKEKAKK